MTRFTPILAAALLAFGAPLVQAAPATAGGIPTAQPEAVGVRSEEHTSELQSH